MSEEEEEEEGKKWTAQETVTKLDENHLNEKKMAEVITLSAQSFRQCSSGVSMGSFIDASRKLFQETVFKTKSLSNKIYGVHN